MTRETTDILYRGYKKIRSSQKNVYTLTKLGLWNEFFFILESLSIFPAARAMAKSSSIGMFQVKEYLSQHSLSQHFRLLISH